MQTLHSSEKISAVWYCAGQGGVYGEIVSQPYLSVLMWVFPHLPDV